MVFSKGWISMDEIQKQVNQVAHSTLTCVNQDTLNYFSFAISKYFGNVRAGIKDHIARDSYDHQ